MHPANNNQATPCRRLTETSRQHPKLGRLVDENGQLTDTSSSLYPAATQELKDAGLLPLHKFKGNVHFGSGGQAEYSVHKDDNEINRVSTKKGTPSGPLVGGGYADYIAKTEQIDVDKSVGPVDDVVIPGGYISADYGTPKLEVDVSWKKAGDSRAQICCVPLSFIVFPRNRSKSLHGAACPWY